MLDLNSARVWLFVVPLLGCRPGGDEVGDDEVGESGESGESGTGDGDGEAESGESGSGESETAETSDADTIGESETTETTDADTTTGDIESECASAAECALVNDCCNCIAVPLGDEPSCEDMACLQPSCPAQFGGFVPEAVCSVGTCQLSPMSCDINQVSCEVVEPPPCEGGLVRSVIGDCYGPCVPAPMCAALPFECDASTCGEGFACVTTQSGASSKCVPLPQGCGGVASCDCVAPWLGEICAGSCGDLDGTLLCQDGG